MIKTVTIYASELKDNAQKDTKDYKKILSFVPKSTTFVTTALKVLDSKAIDVSKFYESTQTLERLLALNLTKRSLIRLYDWQYNFIKTVTSRNYTIEDIEPDEIRHRNLFCCLCTDLKKDI